MNISSKVGLGSLAGNATQVIETVYKDDLWENSLVQAEFLETPGRDIDFDQLNEENMNYSRYGGGPSSSQLHHQQTSNQNNIVAEEIDAKKAVSTLAKVAEDSEKDRFQVQRTRQARVG